MTNPLSPLKYGKVVGRLLAGIIDSPDVGVIPDFPPLEGRVTFTASVPKFLVPNADPPATVAPLTNPYYTATLDDEGYLTWRGERGVYLAAPISGTMNPSGWTWTVSFDLSYLGTPVPISPFSINVPEFIPGPDPEDPDTGSVGLVDLALASPVPSSSGNAVTRGLSVVSVELDGNALVFGLDDGTFLPGVEVPAIQEALDAADDAEDSATAAATSATAAQNAVNSFDLNVGTVTTGAPGSSAVVTIGGGPPVWTADFTIPRGDTGATGPPAPDATTSSKGIVQLAGDLGGTAASPTVPGLAGKANTAHTHTATDISDSTTVGRDVLTAASQAAARTAIGAGTSSLVLGTTAGTAAEGNDSRLSDARTPTAAGQAYDWTMKTHSGARATGAGNIIPEGVRVERNISISAVTFRGETAGTGNLIVELRKNGSNTGMPAASTISAANHAADTVVTAGGPWSVTAGDRITVYITTVDSPAGTGLQASIKATTT
ncbi:hypothetical protein [Nocardia sp. Marseille-Q1738]